MCNSMALTVLEAELQNQSAEGYKNLTGSPAIHGRIKFQILIPCQYLLVSSPIIHARAVCVGFNSYKFISRCRMKIM